MRTGTIGLLTDSGGIVWNVRCNRSDLGFLEFPTVAEYNNSESLGTAVAWINLPIKDEMLIVAIIDRYDEQDFLAEHQFKIFREFNGGHVEISGRGDTGELNITASSESAGGTININATNLAEDAELNLFAKGTVNVESVGKINLRATSSLSVIVEDKSIDDKTTLIEYVKEVGLTYLDEFDNEISANVDNVQIKAAKQINLGDGAEPMVLGDTLESFVSDLVDEIKLITVPTAFGPSGTPINAVAFASLVSTALASIKSQYSKTD